MRTRKRLINPDLAITLYESENQIGNKEMRELFGGMSDATCMKYKNMVYPVMRERNIKVFGSNKVHTRTAFEVWNIDVPQLERGRVRLMKMGLWKENDNAVVGR